MSHYKPYPAYKDSGVEWIGQVPESWERRKIAHAFEFVGSGTTPPTDQQVWYSDTGIPWITTGELRESVIIKTSKYVTTKALEAFSTLRLYPVGSLAIAMYGATIGRLGILGTPATTNQACCVLSGEVSLRIRFVYYWLLAFKQPIIELFAAGGGQPNINQEVIASLRVPAPNLAEQIAIATALDRETTRIDALIAKKTRFIELLKEKRSALITHAVTKGLDPTVKMKNSGVEWIGEVPEHWDVRRVKHLYSARLGKMIQPQPKSDEDVLVPYHRAQTVQWERVEYDQVESMWASPAEVVAYSLEEGDLLICEGGDVCRAAIFNQVERERVIFQNSIHRVRPLDGNQPEWLLRLMQLVRSSGWIDVLCNKNTIVHFTSDKLASLECPHPPPFAQVAILCSLRRETVHIDALIAKVQRSIDLLKERRSAFITAAVTGQIDLQGEIA